METTNFFDTWLNTQNKMINNWVNTTQKMQSAITGGQAMEKGSEIYNEWLKNQTDIVKEAGKVSEEAGEQTAPADFFSKWMNSQKEISMKWMNYNQDIMNNFMHAQGGESNKFGGNWMEAFNTWSKSFGSPFTKMMESMSGAGSKDAFGNILNSTNSYFKMYEVWMPVYKAMTEKGFDPSKMSEMFSAEKFKQVMDNTFQYMYPAPLKDAFENAGQWFESLNSYSKQLTGQYFNNFQNMPKSFPMMFGDNDAMMNAYSTMQGMYQRGVLPVFKFAAPGKESELAQLYIDTVDKYAIYATKLNELQYVMYVSGQKVMEEMITDAYADFSKGGEPVPYNEFFQKWVEKSEKSYVELFKTEEYSKLQGELIDLGIEVKAGFEKLMETMFSQYPVMLRSEADELNKTIYDLKKKVRALELQLNGSDTEEASEEKKAAKKSARSTK